MVTWLPNLGILSSLPIVECYWVLQGWYVCLRAHFGVMQMIMLEGAKATTETVDALRSGATAMKAIQKAT